MSSHPKKATPGKTRGGVRPGAGRPSGSTPDHGTRTTGYGPALAALKKLEGHDLRLALDASPEAKHLVFEARKTILDVMLKPKRWSSQRLTAANAIIEEVCGKLAQKVDQKVDGSLTVEIVQSSAPGATKEEK